MFLLMINLVIFALIMWFFYVQVFIPIMRGTPLFPMFDDEGGLWKRLRRARQGTVEKRIELEAKHEEKRRIK